MRFKSHRHIIAALVCSVLMFAIGAASAANKRPIHRYYNPTIDDYYYTEVQSAAPGYMYQGVAFNVYDQQSGNTSPLYRCKIAAGFGSYSGKHHIRPPGSGSICQYPWNGGSHLLGYVPPYYGTSVKLYAAEVYPSALGFLFINFITISQPEAQQYIDAIPSGDVDYKGVLTIGSVPL